MSDKSQKTEDPTPKRKREAVRDGQVPRSADVGAWLTVLSGILLAPAAAGRLQELFDRLWQSVVGIVVHPDAGSALDMLGMAGRGAVGVLAPILLVSVVVAILGSAVQGGLQISTKRFKPKFDKLNAFKGIKHMFGAQSAWNLVKALLKLAALTVVALVVVRTASERLTASGHWSLSSSVAASVDAAVRLIRLVAIAGLVVAAIDYLIERRRIGKSLKMSLEEVKRESRQSEGDPHQKAVVRSRQREMSSNRMMASIAQADVIVVNPTHVAVALSYESGRGAPRVVAKGAGLVATRIREEAERHRRPMVQDVPLARTLYKACEIGDEIPVEMYDAVARVLAFVMALRRRGTAAGTYRAPTLSTG
jgi:flagellar biosynthetic protein FlhB